MQQTEEEEKTMKQANKYTHIHKTLGVLKNVLLSMHFFPTQMAKANKNPNTIAPKVMTILIVNKILI